jgi:hypothetical protein
MARGAVVASRQSCVHPQDRRTTNVLSPNDFDLFCLDFHVVSLGAGDSENWAVCSGGHSEYGSGPPSRAHGPQWVGAQHDQIAVFSIS